MDHIVGHISIFLSQGRQLNDVVTESALSKDLGFTVRGVKQEQTTCAWPVKVPYLLDRTCPYVYDNLPWADFLKRNGWNIRELIDVLQGRGSPNPKHTGSRAASLVQAWLFFGLIHVMTRVPIDTNAYIETTAAGQSFATTKALPGQLQVWRNAVESSTEEAKKVYIESIDSIWEVLQHTFTTIQSDDDDCFLPQAVLFSIDILVETLMIVKLNIFPNSAPLTRRPTSNYNDKLRNRLSSLGWCAWTIQRLYQSLGSIGLAYMAASQPFDSVRNHLQCTKDKCHALISNPKARHVESTCKCSMLGPKQETLESSLRRGGIPVLRFNEDSSLEVHYYNDASDNGMERPSYVAISHVWADGLGNPEANEMATCQLKLLQKRVDRLMVRIKTNQDGRSGVFCFWIDTICVPHKSGELKNKTIADMTRVYSQAKAVLVIDADLENRKRSTTPGLLAIQIMSAIWWTRLWTIQEASFAKYLLFQLFDECTSAQELLKVVNLDESPSGWDTEQELVKILVRSLNDLNLNNLRAFSGRSILIKLIWRPTTRLGDEPLCLAILRGLPPEEIQRFVGIDVQKGMCQFILAQKYLPDETIFWSKQGGRLQIPGFRWAPITFLGRHGTGLSLSDPDPLRGKDTKSFSTHKSFVDKDGFHGVYLGLQLDLTKWSREATHPDWAVIRVMNLNLYFQAILITPHPPWNDHVGILKDSVIIIPRELGSNHRFLTELWIGGVLVRRINDNLESDEIVVEYVDNLMLQPLLRTPEWIQRFRSMHKVNIIDAVYLSEPQSWCIT